MDHLFKVTLEGAVSVNPELNSSKTSEEALLIIKVCRTHNTTMTDRIYRSIRKEFSDCSCLFRFLNIILFKHFIIRLFDT